MAKKMIDILSRLEEEYGVSVLPILRDAILDPNLLATCGILREVEVSSLPLILGHTNRDDGRWFFLPYTYRGLRLPPCRDVHHSARKGENMIEASPAVEKCLVLSAKIAVNQQPENERREYDPLLSPDCILLSMAVLYPDVVRKLITRNKHPEEVLEEMQRDATRAMRGCKYVKNLSLCPIPLGKYLQERAFLRGWTLKYAQRVGSKCTRGKGTVLVEISRESGSSLGQSLDTSARGTITSIGLDLKCTDVRTISYPDCFPAGCIQHCAVEQAEGGWSLVIALESKGRLTDIVIPFAGDVYVYEECVYAE